MSEAAYMSGKPIVALNAVQSILVEGLATRDDGTPENLQLKRTAPDSAKTRYYGSLSVPDDDYLPAIPNPSQPSLPPDEHVDLALRVGDLLGQSDRNFVYAVTVTDADKIDCYVPPLVIKVAGLYKGRNVSEEAGMYRDLECLQGSIIPRCYGYFFTTVDQAQVSILPWDGPDCKYPREFDRHFPPHPSAPVGIMLLERLGDPIPTGHRTFSDTMRRDLTDMHDELASFGVDDIDWRLANFLSAPPSPPGLSGLPSPNHDHTYSIRMFDFEFSRRTNLSAKALNEEAERHLNELLNTIAWYPASRSHHLPSVWRT